MCVNVICKYDATSQTRVLSQFSITGNFSGRLPEQDNSFSLGNIVIFLCGDGRGKGSGAGCGYPEAKAPPNPSAFWETEEMLLHQILLEILLLPWKSKVSIVKIVFSS